MTETRAVCLNCIDGRVQLPVINWIKQQFEVDCVDMITEPGMDSLLASDNGQSEAINRKVGLSIERNNASMIFVVGHHDCKGNPASEVSHKEQIHLGVDRLKKQFSQMPTMGLWVGEDWIVTKISE